MLFLFTAHRSRRLIRDRLVAARPFLPLQAALPLHTQEKYHACSALGSVSRPQLRQQLSLPHVPSSGLATRCGHSRTTEGPQIIRFPPQPPRVPFAPEERRGVSLKSLSETSQRKASQKKGVCGVSCKIISSRLRNAFRCKAPEAQGLQGSSKVLPEGHPAKRTLESVHCRKGGGQVASSISTACRS